MHPLLDSCAVRMLVTKAPRGGVEGLGRGRRFPQFLDASSSLPYLDASSEEGGSHQGPPPCGWAGLAQEWKVWSEVAVGQHVLHPRVRFA